MLAGSKNKTLVSFSATLGASCYRQKIDLCSMFIFITKCTLKTRLAAVRGVYLHFKVLKCFAVPVQQFHSTHTLQNPLRHHLITQTPQNHSTHIFGQNLTIPYQNSHLKSPQEPQQNTPSPHHLSPTLSNHPTSPKPQ